MKASEIRELGAADLKVRVGQWKEELFRAKLKKFGGEVKDTTATRKLRRTIARAVTILGEKEKNGGN